MRKAIAIVLAFSVVGLTPAEGASAPKSGAKCKKAGLTQSYGGKKYTCIKLGKSLYWDNGVQISKSSQAAAQPLPAATSSTSQQALPQAQQIPCGYGSRIPNAVSSVKAKWDSEDLVISFDWDFKNPNFACPVTELTVELMADGVKRESSAGSRTFLLTPNTTSQVFKVTKKINREILGIFRTSVTGVCLRAYDQFYNKSEYSCAQDVPAYALNLPAPQITVSPATSGYKVAYTTPNSNLFDAIQIVEYVSSSSTEPMGVDYSVISWNRDNPVNVVAQTLSPRWVKARFSTSAGIWTDFSPAFRVVPTAAIQVR